MQLQNCRDDVAGACNAIELVRDDLTGEVTGAIAGIRITGNCFEAIERLRQS